MIHGKGPHRTEECRTILGYIKKKKRGFNNSRPIAEVDEITEVDSNEKLNKNLSYYSLTKSPFIRKFQFVGGIPHECLIDTGACCSVVNSKVLPKNAPIFKTNTQLKSVTGEKLETIGKVKDLRARIEGKEITMDAIVTTEDLKSSIVGAETIKKNKEILIEALEEKTEIINTITKATRKEAFFTKYKNIFTTEIPPNNLCNTTKHGIETSNENIIYQRNTRIPINFEKSLDMEIEKLLKLGIIRESKSPWNSRIVPVTKPDGSIRLCIDYRDLNEITIRDRYPLPSIQELLDKLGSAKIFSKLDATSGYYQIAVDERDIEKTAFSYKNGFYEFVRMPFGLCNGPATFQRAMDNILRQHLGKMVMPYLVDIIIFSKNEEKHEKDLEIIMGKLKAANIFLNKKKCDVYQDELKILGFIIGNGKIGTDPGKIRAIKDYSLPKTIKDFDLS